MLPSVFVNLLKHTCVLLFSKDRGNQRPAVLLFTKALDILNHSGGVLIGCLWISDRFKLHLCERFTGLCAVFATWVSGLQECLFLCYCKYSHWQKLQSTTLWHTRYFLHNRDFSWFSLFLLLYYSFIQLQTNQWQTETCFSSSFLVFKVLTRKLVAHMTGWKWICWLKS